MDNVYFFFLQSGFDAVTINFGVLHLARPELALAEAYRVLKPNGRLAFTVWAPPPASRAFGLILDNVRRLGNPDVPLPAGPPFFQYSDPTVARQRLEAVGFV